MKEVFQKRRRLFLGQCLKYLRYVLNDHFVLVLFFLLGFLMFQYGKLLQHFPKNVIWLEIILAFVALAMLSLGKIATYIEAPDKLFYLPKEEEVVSLIHQARIRSFGIWTVIQTVVLILLAPIFFKLGMSLAIFIVLVIILAILKWFVMTEKEKVFFKDGHFSWEKAINYESKRRQGILKFFALFTTVKGISASVKRRAYLDKLLLLVKKTHAKTWSNLYLRAFLRSSDYLALTLRLSLLSILALLFIPNHLVAAGLALVFNYLLLFQLLSLAQHFDYQYLTRLYPISETQKKANLKVFLRCLSYLISLIELVLCFSLKAAGLIILVTVIVTEWYLPYKIAKMID
ncbi:ABC transporter permease [Streptococcus equinus]|uniref:ABC transporter permease n=1 Tax=Streptococcus equinus TaxID=1335 RepID=UPI00088EEFAD|nr:ABC transporter permease [Streptococcus equinus]SDQ57886.1 ABC-2 type transport system permease protein [Streptococcus equinus]SEN88596.1 ABC-2 type transport system permease protein [Streptococcus equinus]